ncbi:MAG: UDP-N-acetylglucosamine pyrophosphorylase [Lachnospiraceae bacterium]|nr:UDP-N-acetylglucosamine pyrophosphorylase [Lachnospiraceae bacterium]
MDRMLIKNLYNLEETIAASFFDGAQYPWELLGEIGEYIVKLGNSLDPEKYEKRAENVWVARNAKVFDSAYLGGPCIIDEEAEVRHCAFIRGNAIVGKGAVVGNSTELKNVILFNKVQVPHYNYVGDSILGYKSHMGAGSITSNVKSDKTLVTIRCGEKVVETGRKKMGAMLGDGVEVGCNSVLNPGTVIGRGSSVYPTSSVRGFIPENHIFKSTNCVVARQ